MFKFFKREKAPRVVYRTPLLPALKAVIAHAWEEVLVPKYQYMARSRDMEWGDEIYLNYHGQVKIKTVQDSPGILFLEVNFQNDLMYSCQYNANTGEFYNVDRGEGNG